MEGGREIWREGGRYGGREGDMEGGREIWREGGRYGGREGDMEGGREIWREGGRYGGREGDMEGGRERRTQIKTYASLLLFSSSPSPQIQGRSKSITSDHEIKMGISTVPPQQPQDKAPLRVHTVDHTYCRLQVRLDTTARDIIKEACQKLELREGQYQLCEVKSSGEVVKLNDKDVSVHSGRSVNGRLYVVPKKSTDKMLVSSGSVYVQR